MWMQKVFVTTSSYAKQTPEATDLLKRAGLEVRLSDLSRAHTSSEILQRLGDGEALLVYNTFDEVNSQVIHSAPKLKVISRHGVGIEMIDVAAAQSRGVTVRNTLRARAHEAVANFTMAMILNCARDIYRRVRETKAGQWLRQATGDVDGETLGIIGLGRVGQAVAKRAVSCGMRILAYELHPDRAFCEEHGVRLVELGELLRESAVVTLHVPLEKSTEGLIGKDELSLMKSTAFLINTARSKIVDNEALYNALKDATIAGAAVDVFDQEPPMGDRLLGLDNLLPTPHIAGITRQAMRNMDIDAAVNIVEMLNPFFRSFPPGWS
jgi:D-3-phosphoglycerate dehydrogenase